MVRPHDITDLYLAPVVLAIDAELEALRGKSYDDILMYVALATNREPRTRIEKRKYFIEAVTKFHELHGWEVTCHPRGLRLTHDGHQIVLGLPPAVYSYLELSDEETPDEPA
ncbi:MAG: hypothetical protein IRY85_01695 [Micromonosporaceae bacterium]|nr:hypothetical protein [Micromonosporaceae bacterium]